MPRSLLIQRPIIVRLILPWSGTYPTKRRSSSCLPSTELSGSTRRPFPLSASGISVATNVVPSLEPPPRLAPPRCSRDSRQSGTSPRSRRHRRTPTSLETGQNPCVLLARYVGKGTHGTEIPARGLGPNGGSSPPGCQMAGPTLRFQSSAERRDDCGLIDHSRVQGRGRVQPPPQERATISGSPLRDRGLRRD